MSLRNGRRRQCGKRKTNEALQGAGRVLARCRKDRAMNITRRFILPPEAESILSRMTGNRKRRKTYVDTLAADMREGRWVDTHEPIAMSVDGNLIDGQHRLAAVVLSGVGQWFWVAVYDTHQTAIGLPIDCGVRRTTADLLGLNRKFAEVASAIQRHVIAQDRLGVRAVHIERIADVCRDHILEVMEVSRGNKRLRASATARAAVVVNMLLYPDETGDILNEYSRWVACENATWNSVKALNKQLDSMSKCKTDVLFLRLCKAFSPSQKQRVLLRVNDSEALAMRKELREKLTALFYKTGKP